jgi:hypothetical protein
MAFHTGINPSEGFPLVHKPKGFPAAIYQPEAFPSVQTIEAYPYSNKLTTGHSTLQSTFQRGLSEAVNQSAFPTAINQTGAFPAAINLLEVFHKVVNQPKGFPAAIIQPEGFPLSHQQTKWFWTLL